MGCHGWLYHLTVDDEHGWEICIDVPHDGWILWYVRLCSFTIVQLLRPCVAVALTLVWVGNAIPRPPAKRSAAMGLVNGFGNLGNLYVGVYSCHESHSPHGRPLHSIGSYIWKSNWGPEYHQSMIIAFCALVLASILSFGVCSFPIRDASHYN